METKEIKGVRTIVGKALMNRKRFEKVRKMCKVHKNSNFIFKRKWD